MMRVLWESQSKLNQKSAHESFTSESFCTMKCFCSFLSSNKGHFLRLFDGKSFIIHLMVYIWLFLILFCFLCYWSWFIYVMWSVSNFVFFKWMSNSSHIIYWRTVSLLLRFNATVVINQAFKNATVYFWTLWSFSCLFSNLVLISHFLDCYCFKISLDVKLRNASHVLFSKESWLLLTCYFYVHFRTSSLSSTISPNKKQTGILQIDRIF